MQVSSRNLHRTYNVAQDLAARIRTLPGVGEVYIPQDMNYPAVRLNVDRVHAAELGLTQKEIVDNVITALNSNTMIAPNYWVDHQTGNDYFLTVQYYENGKPAIHNLMDLKNIPIRAPDLKQPTTLDSVVQLENTYTATQIVALPDPASHRCLRHAAGRGPRQGRERSAARDRRDADFPRASGFSFAAWCRRCRSRSISFAVGLSLAVVLLYLILVAQFRSFKDPFLIMLAIPMGFIGVLVVLPLTHTTLNVMSLMGVLMLVGIAASNSILIVEFAHRLEEQQMSVEDAVITSCRVRLRPILMTSLATIIGMVPMALKMGTGSEQYAPLARAIIGGLTVSVVLTVFIVPAAYLMVYRRRTAQVID